MTKYRKLNFMERCGFQSNCGYLLYWIIAFIFGYFTLIMLQPCCQVILLALSPSSPERNFYLGLGVMWSPVFFFCGAVTAFAIERIIKLYKRGIR